MIILTASLVGCEFSSVYTPSAVACCTAIAIDPSDDGITLTLEIVSGSGESSEISYASSSGSSIEAIIDKLMQKIPGKLLLNTAQVILISSELGSRLYSFVNYAIKQHELNLHSTVAVARGHTAAALLTGSNGKITEQPKGIKLFSLISDSRSAAVYKSSLLELLKRTNKKNSASLVICAVSDGTDGIAVNGAGAYSDGSLICWLDSDDVKLLNIVNGNAQRQTVFFQLDKDNIGASESDIALKSLKSSFSGDSSYLTVSIAGSCNCSANECEKFFVQKTEELYRKTYELGLDIFGITEYLYKYDHSNFGGTHPEVSFSASLGNQSFKAE